MRLARPNEDPPRKLAMKTGRFITFEGIDGCGKTTQLRALATRLRATGRDVVETLEPGGTEIGNQIRRILLDHKNTDLTKRAELLLYFASRAQNVEQVIRPALEAGKIVLCDRFTDSTLVYQGCGRGLGSDIVLSLDIIACAGLAPDLTVFLAINLDTSLRRARGRNTETATEETRMDDQSRAFYANVEEGYRKLCTENPQRILPIDASGDISAVSERVWEAVHPLLIPAILRAPEPSLDEA